MDTCSAEGCDRPAVARGLCKRDHKRALKHGELTIIHKIRPHDVDFPTWFAEQLTSDPDHPGCMVWTLHRKKPPHLPYGEVRFEGKQRATHNVAWELVSGPIPEGLLVLHSCHNPPCCNIEHLRLGTNDDNMADKVAAGRQSRMPGENHPLARLTNDDVRAIRAHAAEGVMYWVIAELFSISEGYVSMIVNRRTWKHVE